MSEWISVEDDNKPNDQEECLCCNEGAMTFVIASWSASYGAFDMWRCYTHRYIAPENVTHWQPLPDPPE